MWTIINYVFSKYDFWLQTDLYSTSDTNFLALRKINILLKHNHLSSKGYIIMNAIIIKLNEA